MSDDNDEITTTDAGIPASSDEHSLTVGPDGPILLQDHYLIQKMAQFNRERVPERVVHAKGGGAHGYFEVTADVTPFTKAKFLDRMGKRTPVFIRFSTVAGELGSPDPGLQDPSWFVDGEIVRSAYTLHREDDAFVQPRTLWEQVLSATDQQHMVGNLVARLKAGVRRDIIDRVLEYWRSVHPEISAGIARGLGVPMKPAA